MIPPPTHFYIRSAASLSSRFLSEPSIYQAEKYVLIFPDDHIHHVNPVKFFIF